MSEIVLNTFKWDFDSAKWRQFLDSGKDPYEWVNDVQQVADQLTTAAWQIDDALNDYCTEKFFYGQPDGSDRAELESYVADIFTTAEEVEDFLNRGQAMGLTIQEIALVDSLFGIAPNNYPEDCVAASREIWKSVAPYEPAKGQVKSVAQERQFILDMRDQFVLPVLKKYDLELEPYDLGPKPIGYVSTCLARIYRGNDTYDE